MHRKPDNRSSMKLKRPPLELVLGVGMIAFLAWLVAK